MKLSGLATICWTTSYWLNYIDYDFILDWILWIDMQMFWMQTLLCVCVHLHCSVCTLSAQNILSFFLMFFSFGLSVRSESIHQLTWWNGYNSTDTLRNGSKCLYVLYALIGYMPLRIFADRNRAIIVNGMIWKCAMQNYWLELAASKQSKGFDL